MNDDFNTPETIACLFELLRFAQILKQKKAKISIEVLNTLQNTYRGFLNNVLGVEMETSNNDELLSEVLDILIDVRKQARSQKYFKFSDHIRDQLAAIGIQVNDEKGMTTFDFDRN